MALRRRRVGNSYYVGDRKVLAGDPRARPRQLIRGALLDKVIRMYKGDGVVKGMSARKLAPIIGVSDSTIRQALPDAGIPSRGREKLTPAEQDRACEMYLSMPYPCYEDVAPEFDCCAEVIRKLIHKRGIMRPKFKLGAETHAEILLANEARVCPAKIAKKYGVDRNTIVNTIRRCGGQVRGPRDDVHRTIPLNVGAFSSRFRM